jgi:flagellar hook-associated protein 1 FlgK
MSLTQSLHAGLSGLTVNARLSEIVSSNIANALTDGYARRVADLSSRALGEGSAVQVAAIRREVDPFLLAARRDAGSSQSRDSALSQALVRLEQTFGDASSDTSIGARVTAFQQSLVSVAADPSSDLRLDTAVRRLGDLVTTLRGGETAIQAQRTEAEAAIGDQVSRLNTALSQVERLNADITAAMFSGSDVTALQEQRQLLVDDISAIVPVREVQRDHGQIALYAAGGLMLVERRATQFGFDQASVVTSGMSLGAGTLAGLTVDGQPLQPAGAGRLTGGSLEAAFRLRDVTLPAAQRDLDLLAEDLVARFQDPAVDPTLAPGDAGLLTDSGAAYLAGNLNGLAGRLRINAAVDPAQGGLLSRLRDGMNAAVPGPLGRATQIESWIATLEGPRALSTGGPARGAGGHASQFMSSIGNARANAERDLGFSTARWTGMRSEELAQGVDSDQEMQKLLLIEQAYAANARVIQAVDEMMMRILEI